jgi:hypothetical protein
MGFHQNHTISPKVQIFHDTIEIKDLTVGCSIEIGYSFGYTV